MYFFCENIWTRGLCIYLEKTFVSKYLCIYLEKTYMSETRGLCISFVKTFVSKYLCIFDTNMCLYYDVFYLEKTLGLEVYVFLW
jgi:hypothetical protein